MKFIIPGDIPSLKNDLKFARGRCYHSAEVVNYKKMFCLLCPRVCKQLIDKPVCVTLHIYKKDNRKDGCNLSGIIHDCLQISGVIKNDRLIVERHEYDYIDKKNPRCEIFIQEIEHGKQPAREWWLLLLLWREKEKFRHDILQRLL